MSQHHLIAASLFFDSYRLVVIKRLVSIISEINRYI